MKLLSTTQAAEILGVNDSRIRQLIRDGQLQAVQVGRAYLLDETVVQSFQRPPMGRPKKEGVAGDVQASPPAQTKPVKARAAKSLTDAEKARIRDEQQARWRASAPGSKPTKKGGKK